MSPIMQLLKRLLAVCVLALCWSAAHAQFYAGYTPRGPADADEMAYAAAIEGAHANMHSLLKVTPPYSIANGSNYTASQFRDGLTTSTKTLFGIVECRPEITQSYWGTSGLWTVHTMYTERPWQTQFRYHQPATAPETWKRPVLVINDGLGIDLAIGVTSRGMPGENIGQALANAGHPVFVMGLKGMDTTSFSGVWGLSGRQLYEAMMKVSGKDMFVEWVQDAHDAACLLERWHPGKTIGVTGVSKSAALAALTALFRPSIDRVLLASGFAEFERKFLVPNPFAYAPGQHLVYERSALLLGLQGKQVRLSYSETDDLLYRVEALDQRTLNIINGRRAAWGIDLLTQHNHLNGHYYDTADAIAFFGQ